MPDPRSPRTDPPPGGLSPASDDSSLVAAARAGSHEAAERLAAATYERLWASCLRLTGDPDRAADLVQETYRKAWQALPRFRGDAQFSTWLFRIAFTTHLKIARRPRRVVPIEPVQEENAADPAPDPETTTGEAERAHRLRRAVAALPDDLRYAVSAHYWGEVPVRDIALESGITPVAVRKRMAKALRVLAAVLQENPR